MQINISRVLGRKNLQNIPHKEIENKENNYFVFHEGFAKIKRKDKFEFIDEQGNVITTKGYEYADDFENGLARVSHERYDKIGYIDVNGKEIIECKYHDVEPLENGLYYVRFYRGLSEGRHILDKEGNKIYDLKNNYLEERFNNSFIVKKELTGNWFIIDNKGNRLTKDKYKYIGDIKENIAVFKDKKNKYGFIDENGNIITKKTYDKALPFTNGYGIVKEGSSWIYIDKIGEEVLKVYYDKAYPFYEDLATVKINDKYGVINKEGKLVIYNKYDSIEPFEKGLAIIGLNDKYGVINKEGKELIKPIYNHIEEYNENYIVKKDNMVGMVDKKGNIIVEIKYEEIKPLNDQFLIVKTHRADKGIINNEGQFVYDCLLSSVALTKNEEEMILKRDYFDFDYLYIPLNEISYDVVIKHGDSVVEKKFNTADEQNNYYNQVKIEIDKEISKSQLEREELKKALEESEHNSFEFIKEKIKSI